MADQQDFAEQAMEYAPQLYSAALRMTRNQADAEDLVHDVFLGLSRAAQTFEGRGTFEGWLSRVTIRTALMRLRRSDP